MEQGERRMTKDEIQKNSEHWYNKYKDAEKRIAELEAQIEKMKCCSNCQTVRDAEGNCYLKKDGKCKNKDKWELRR